MKENDSNKTKEYQEEVYNKYQVDIEKYTKEIDYKKRIEKEEKEKKVMGKSLKESDRNEKLRWKNIKQKEKENQCKLKEENKQKKIEMMKEFVNEKELQLLEKRIGRESESIIFNSEKDEWSLQHSTFLENVRNKSNISIIIETIEGKKFGCYIDSSITELGEYIVDQNAFIFNFVDETIEKYPIKDIHHSFKIERQWNKTLFIIGNEDIIIKKSENKNNCSCKQTSFEYYGKQNVLTETKEGKFEIKKFVVVQMEMTLKEQRNNIISTKLFTKESEVQIIEDWCDLTLQDVIFDSKYDNWDIGTSVFNDKVSGRENLVFIIEDIQNNIFGGFIKSPINSNSDNSVYDKNAFLFILRLTTQIHQPIKYQIKEDQCENAFQLFDKDNESLFVFGKECDIKVFKKDKSKGLLSQNTFDYDDKENIFVDKEEFTVKRIQVWQMKMTESQRHKKEENEKNKLKEELKKLQEVSPTVITERKEEIRKLEILFGVTYDRLVFDTDLCDWDIHTTMIDKHIVNRKKLVFLIEDVNDNLFGGFINEKISDCDLVISDPKSFIFILKSNGKLTKPERFVKNNESPISLQLFRKHQEKLFSFGETDIVVNKKYKSTYYCKPNSFYYKENENIFTGNGEEEKQIQIKRIQIWQMKITNELEQKLKEMTTINSEKESKQLKEITYELNENKPKDMKIIEKWCDLLFDKVIFDSDYSNWSINTSSFDKHVYNKRNLVFMIEDTEGNVFGGFIKSKINSITYEENDITKREAIDDDKAFVFSLKSNGRLQQPEKYQIQTKECNDVFDLFDDSNEKLFTIGKGDICVLKKDIGKGWCKQHSFDYEGKESILIGKEGEDNTFTVKKIQVWQMIESLKNIKKDKIIETQIEQLFEKEKNETQRNRKYIERFY